MKGKIALMVEDNEHVLALNRSVLEREGCTVLPAGNLAGARRALAEHPNPDIVVLDILQIGRASCRERVFRAV